MRELGLVGLLGLIFGLGSYRGIGTWEPFGIANVVVGTVALAIVGVRSLRRASHHSGVIRHEVTLEPILRLVAIAWAAILVQQAISLSGARFDFTFERRYELAPATVAAVEALPGRTYATLFVDSQDPRRRRTRLLLEQLEASGDLVVRERDLGDAPEEEDYFAIRSSNTVVFENGERWERVDRPTEGGLFEALAYLGVHSRRVVYVTAGAGEGSLANTTDVGFSGLAAALETEGIELRQLASARFDAVPEDAEAVMLLAPERRLHPTAKAALERYLADGGNLIVLLEPGAASGADELLAEWGITPLPGVVIDPAMGSVMGEQPGLDLVAFNYSSDESVTRGLDSNRQVYLRGARTFALRKPSPEDRLRGLVFASRDSWRHPDPDVVHSRRVPQRPPDVATDYHPLVVSGRFQRGDAEVRIVAFGDASFANNANLRSLYNLDLMMNAVHWALRDEPRISLRPKAGQLIQFPLPIQNSLKAFYGVGLLIPELLLLGAGVVWLRRRTL